MDILLWRVLNVYNNRIFKIPGSLPGRIGILFILAFALIPGLFAQSITITGVITDGSSNETLPGVNVVVEGTTVGAITDLNGKYTITLPSADATLIFSYVGYTPQTIPVEGRAQIDIALMPGMESLDEVVVIGYGTARKRDLSGSISTLKSVDINDGFFNSQYAIVHTHFPKTRLQKPLFPRMSIRSRECLEVGAGPISFKKFGKPLSPNHRAQTLIPRPP